MTDSDRDLEVVLRGARRGLAPSAADEQRVLASLSPLLALDSAVTPPAPPAGRPWQILAGGLALGVAVGVGYGWGYHAGKSATPAPTVAATSRPIEALSAAAALPSAAQVHEMPPEIVAPRPTPRASTAPSASAAGLDEEVRQLRRIERAVRDGNPQLALALVGELDAAIPRGQLLPERRAAALMASCQLGAPNAPANAAAFLRKQGASAYAARLRELCGVSDEQRNAEASGTDASRKGGTP